MMQELRYNPITGEWIIVSAATQVRPVQPSKTSCPICPGGVEFPDILDYDLATFENRYPSLRRDAPEPNFREKGPFMKERALGICEVVVYTSKHDSSLPKMSPEQIHKLVKMWKERTRDLAKEDFIKYIFIFENRGKEVGASLPHPHGQIYAFPFIPMRIKAKIEAMKRWYEERKKCLICEVIENENERIVYETKHFIALVPFYARFPYEVHIYPKRHISGIVQLSEKEERDLAEILKIVTMKYDALFEQEFPYMMMLFQAPVNLEEEVNHFFHFHIEFNPPKRDKNKLKWMASVETGTWTFINPIFPEEAAKRLREVKTV